MQIIIEKNKIKVIHPSGIVRSYDTEQIEFLKQNLQEEITIRQNQISQLGNWLNQMKE